MVILKLITYDENYSAFIEIVIGVRKGWLPPWIEGPSPMLRQTFVYAIGGDDSDDDEEPSPMLTWTYC